MGATGYDEILPVKTHHEVYAAIDPQHHWKDQTYKGKVAFITGASRGIGRAIALFYAKAGASVAISARKQETLQQTKDIILKDVPHAQVGIFLADVKDPDAVALAVSGAVEQFGRLDVLIANAAASLAFDTLMVDRDAKMWWNTFEVNLFGVYNFVKAAMMHLQRAHGHIVAVSSIGAQLRGRFASDYSISKHALNRLVEFIAEVEYPEIKIFSFHPGGVRTELAISTRLEELFGVEFNDPPELAAAATLCLTSGRYDWLNGRYYSVDWDIEEVERDWKDKILEKELLVSKLAVS
ncbi:NAD-P-binding protein [Vararia minispora EC-137]|uniref:NAD-P-binding protein n=1 Tax=Vararia minispora EC-137 TaxID=1314806 RepID=A0ACB8QRV5_9AGAM|nr:NAD-P-binding protein [Vararia minispora EC-137]